MNRRSFFGRLIGGLGAAMAAPFLLRRQTTLSAATGPTTAPMTAPVSDNYLLSFDEAALRERYVVPAIKHMFDESEANMLRAFQAMP